MRDCSGLHCPGCGNGATGGGAAVLAGIAALAVLWHYAGAILRVLAVMLTITVIAAGTLTALVAGGLAVAAIRRRRARPSIPDTSYPALRAWDRPTIRPGIVPAGGRRELPAPPEGTVPGRAAYRRGHRRGGWPR